MAPPLCKLGIRFDHTKGMFCAFFLGFGLEIGLNLSEDLFFGSSPNFGRKIGLNLSRTISDSDLCSSQIPPPPFFRILRTLLPAGPLPSTLPLVQGRKCRLVIDTTFFAFLLSIIADALLSIFSTDYCLLYAFCSHVIDW